MEEGEGARESGDTAQEERTETDAEGGRRCNDHVSRLRSPAATPHNRHPRVRPSFCQNEATLNPRSTKIGHGVPDLVQLWPAVAASGPTRANAAQARNLFGASFGADHLGEFPWGRPSPCLIPLRLGNGGASRESTRRIPDHSASMGGQQPNAGQGLAKNGHTWRDLVDVGTTLAGPRAT